MCRECPKFLIHRTVMNFKNPFSRLTRFEFILWISSLVVVSLSFILSPEPDLLSLIASLVGVTSLIFIARGMAFGQFLIIIFAILYGIVSIRFSYWGEMITYLFMSAPAALASLIAWLKNPYGKGDEVKVRPPLTTRAWLFLSLVTALVTFAFYFILKALGTANLAFSVLSVTTSFFAAGLTFLRIPYYALAYAANDIVLIVLWVLATLESFEYLPMIFCFVMFLINDIYGFISWRRMERRQG